MSPILSTINRGADAPLTPIVLQRAVICSPPAPVTCATDRKPPGKDATIGLMKAILHTSAGDITVELFPNHAPNTVNNFVTLAKGERDPTANHEPAGRHPPG